MEAVHQLNLSRPSQSGTLVRIEPLESPGSRHSKPCGPEGHSRFNLIPKMLRKFQDLLPELDLRANTGRLQGLHGVKQRPHAVICKVSGRHRLGRRASCRDCRRILGRSCCRMGRDRRLHRHSGFHLSCRPLPSHLQGLPRPGIIAAPLKISEHPPGTVDRPVGKAQMALTIQRPPTMFRDKPSVSHEMSESKSSPAFKCDPIPWRA